MLTLEKRKTSSLEKMSCKIIRKLILPKINSGDLSIENAKIEYWKEYQKEYQSIPEVGERQKKYASELYQIQKGAWAERGIEPGIVKQVEANARDQEGANKRWKIRQYWTLLPKQKKEEYKKRFLDDALPSAKLSSVNESSTSIADNQAMNGLVPVFFLRLM